MNLSSKEIQDFITEAKQQLTEEASLLNLLKIESQLAENPQHATEVYHLIGKIYQLRHDLEKAIVYYTRSLEASDLTTDIDYKAKTYTNLGVLYSNQGNFLESKRNQLMALELKKSSSDKASLANSLYNLGGNCVHLEEYVEGANYYDSAKKIYEQVGNDLMTSHCLYSMGMIYNLNENHSIALEYFVEALSNLAFDTDKVLYIMLNIHIGGVYISTNNFTLAEKSLKRSLELSKKNDYVLGEVNSLVMLGEMYLKENKLELAKQYCISVLAIKGESYYDAHSIANMNLGIIFFQKEELEKASNFLHTALEISKKHELQKRKGEILHHLILYYNKIDAFKDAFDIQTELLALKDIYHEKKVDAKLAEIKHQTEKERIERETSWHEQKNIELEKEKARGDELLKNILPDSVAEELKNTGSAKAVYYDDVTVLFTDFHQFSRVSQQLEPQELVAELHECFKSFDEIVSKYHIEKIKTVGDAYLAVSGLPESYTNHAEDIVLAAIEIRNFIKHRKEKLGDKTFGIRIGIHTGAVVAGIVGVKKFAYDIWGDTVNTAARFEQNSPIGQISISEITYQRIKDKIPCFEEDTIEAKNIGLLKRYIVK